MSRHWKPKPPEIDWEIVSKRDRFPCDSCGNIIMGSRLSVTMQTNYFRGDDEVTFYCVPCALSKGYKPNNPICRLIVEKMTAEELHTIVQRMRLPSTTKDSL